MSNRENWSFRVFSAIVSMLTFARKFLYRLRTTEDVFKYKKLLVYPCKSIVVDSLGYVTTVTYNYILFFHSITIIFLFTPFQTFLKQLI